VSGGDLDQRLLPTTVQDSAPNTLDKPNAPRSGCRDPIFALLFLANLAVIVYLAAKGGMTLGDSGTSGVHLVPKDVSSRRFFGCLAGILSTAVVLCLAWTVVTMNHARAMIKGSYIAWGFLYGVGLVVGIAMGFVWFAIICAFMMLMVFLGWRAVCEHIPFAAANLVVACRALQAHKSVLGVVITMLAASVTWSIAWALAIVGIGGSSSHLSAGAVFLLIVSYYWGGIVCTNINHVTVAGTVGSWWFNHEQAQSSLAVTGAWFRAMTSSFGSICFGSLLVAILEAMRAMCRQARKGKLAFLACILDCILRCVERWMQYINRYAFVYVGLYGKDFCAAGSDVSSLFSHRGFWDTVVNDVVISRTLNLGTLGIAACTGAVGLICGKPIDMGVPLCLFGLISGFMLASITMGTIDSAVATVYVAFGENPHALRANHPESFEDLYGAWYQRFPQLVAYVVVEESPSAQYPTTAVPVSVSHVQNYEGP